MNTDKRLRSYDEFRQDKFFDVPNIITRTSVSKVELPMLFDRVRVRHLNFLSHRKGSIRY